MELIVLRKGMKGDAVGDWQLFLRGLNYYFGRIDDDFGNMTHNATIKFQKKWKLKPDGVVGNKTYGKAIMLGFDVESVDDNDPKYSASYPPKPDFKPLTTYQQRVDLFGEFEYEATPTQKNPEKIKILGNWKKENIVMVSLPALSKATNGKYTRMQFHKKGKDQLEAMFNEFEKQNLHKRILTYAGAYYPRFVRGSKKTLSNHSWGSAFDVNVAWNGLNRQPALVGQKGCVRELVPIANEYGFYWGGHFKRKDGMHLEIAKLL